MRLISLKEPEGVEVIIPVNPDFHIPHFGHGDNTMHMQRSVVPMDTGRERMNTAVSDAWCSTRYTIVHQCVEEDILGCQNESLSLLLQPTQT